MEAIPERVFTSLSLMIRRNLFASILGLFVGTRVKAAPLPAPTITRFSWPLSKELIADWGKDWNRKAIKWTSTGVAPHDGWDVKEAQSAIAEIWDDRPASGYFKPEGEKIAL